MPITPPALGNVPTPSGFIVQSAQGVVILNWNFAPIATTYYINRSTDGVTFSAIGQTSALQFVDSTAVLNTIYFYTIQGATNTASSIPTYALTAQSLKPGQTTLGNMRLEVQQRSDLVNSFNITTQEWNSMISQSYKELYDILIQKFGNDYYIQIPYTWQTTGTIDPIYQAQVFALPNDFYKSMRVEVALNPSDPNSWITLKKFEAIQANLWNYPNVYTFYGITNLRYRIWGSNLQIVPISQAGQTIRMWYSPRPNQLINDADIIDGISGYEEYIIADTAIKALVKQESIEQAQAFSLQKDALMKRIEQAAENRDVGTPETVSDSRRANFSWNDPSDGGAYGGC